VISRFFINRPIFAAVLSIVIVLAGGVSIPTLPIAQYPDITPPTVQVSCSYPGANAQVVADTVAAPIEQQVNGVENMLYMSSQCTNDGAYVLTVTFDLGTDLKIALVQVQNRVQLAMPQMPSQVQAQGINIKKKTPCILMAVNLISPDGRYDTIYMSNYAMLHVRDELLRLPGVSDVTLLGERDYAIRAWLDPEKLAARNITASEVAVAIQEQNNQVVAGQLGQPPTVAGQNFQPTLTALGRLTEPEQFGQIVVKTGSPAPGSADVPVVRLSDVARVELGAQQYDQACLMDGKPSVAMAIFQTPTANMLDTADGVRRKMEQLKQSFPDGLDYAYGVDTTPFIRESIVEVLKTLRDAIILVAIVVLVFLQNWRATIIPLVAVPVAIVGTFAVMAAMGFSLNNLSLFGLVLAIGIVVDDAIVVVENVERWLAAGLPPKEAAIKAMQEVTGPVIAVGLVLCAVFVPCAFITGITGQFFRQFALTIAVSTVISAFNSLTLSPALAALLLKPHAGHAHATGGPMFGQVRKIAGVAFDRQTGLGTRLAALAGLLPAVVLALPAAAWQAFLRLFNATFDWSTNVYTRWVGRLLRGSLLVLLLYVGLLVLTGWSFQSMPGGFIPDQDKGRLLVNVQLPDGASVQRTQEVVAQIDRLARSIPGVQHTLAVAGQSLLLQANAPNFGSLFVILKPFDERHGRMLYDKGIAFQLRRLCYQKIPDAMVTVFGAPPVDGLGTAGGFKLLVEDRGSLGTQTLQQMTDGLIDRGNHQPGLMGLFTLYRSNTPQLYVDIDRTKVKSLGVSLSDVFNTLQVFMGSLYVNNFNQFGRSWQVDIQAEGAFRNRVEKVGQLKVRNSSGQMVPMNTLARISDAPGPVMITRYQLYPAAPINGNMAPGMSSGQAVALMNHLAREELPKSMPIEWTELTLLQIRAGNTATYVFVLAVVLVFLVLAAQYESWSLPLAVILVVPMCLLCSIAGVALLRMDINIFTQIGFVVLVGLASKNAILIVEFAKQQREAGKDVREATLEACRLRLRPIMMTSFAFILGVVPLVVAQGAGAEMRRTLGTAVFSGMLGVTLFGIFLTPVFFFAIDRWSESRLFAAAGVRRAAGLGLAIVTLGIPWAAAALRRRAARTPATRQPSSPEN
jgi:multidrug efflux pump subunit AcrB